MIFLKYWHQPVGCVVHNKHFFFHFHNLFDDPFMLIISRIVATAITYMRLVYVRCVINVL